MLSKLECAVILFFVIIAIVLVVGGAFLALHTGALRRFSMKATFLKWFSLEIDIRGPRGRDQQPRL